MNPKRLEFALDKLTGADWEKFEKLASEFLATDYSGLRTMASPSGDGGRDAELFTSGEESNVVFQYSVSKDWKAKINRTVNRIAEVTQARALIYVTNQVVGAQADDLRRTLRKDRNISLDILDRNWFVERCNTNFQRETAAERLAEEIVNPLLASQGMDLPRFDRHISVTQRSLLPV